MKFKSTLLMKKIFLIISSLFLTISVLCQTKSNLSKFNFEFENVKNKLPLNWENFGSSSYTLTLDSLVKKSGKYSMAIEYIGEVPDFKALAFKLPDNYKGKKITLSGYVKTENVKDGWAGLWMRIDPNIAFENMQQNGILGTTDWKKYEITLDMSPEKTDQIVVGGILAGKGKMWLDDLNIIIDGKDINVLKPIQKKEILLDKEFEDGSKINEIILDKNKIENLKTLGLVWGFLKYYHPNIKAGHYNFDYELFKVLPKLLKANTVQQRDEVLVKWIKGFGKFKSETIKGKPTAIVKIKPDLDWIENSNLSTSLSSMLMKVKTAKKNDESYYVDMVSGVGNPKFKNENSYSKMNFPDAGFRLLSLYRYWNIIQYFYPNKNLINEDWKNILTEFIPKIIDAKSEIEYKLVVLELIARIHDTHANIWGNDDALEIYRGLNNAPIEVSFIENKVVVKKFYDKILGKKSQLKIGDVIEEINHKLVDDIVKEKLPLTPSSNYPTQLRDIASNLLRTNDTILNIVCKRDTSTINMKVKCYNKSQLNSYSLNQKKDTCFRFIKPEIAYLFLGSIKNSYIPDLWKKIENTKGLIIDLRCYPSEFVVFTLGQYLMPKSTEFVKFSVGSKNSPGQFTETGALKLGKNNKESYKGLVVILVNETTQSQAEYTAMAFKVAPNVKIIGSTTAGADGNVSSFELPGGIYTMISGIGVYYPDGKETQRIGIVPDIETRPTIIGIKLGQDELLERAIEEIKNNTKSVD